MAARKMSQQSFCGRKTKNGGSAKMSIKLEKVVEHYYEALEEGKILGRKCPVCGNVEFPPVYACNKCGNYETE